MPITGLVGAGGTVTPTTVPASPSRGNVGGGVSGLITGTDPITGTPTITPTVGGSPGATPASQDAQGAQAILRNFLHAYDLDALYDQAKEWLRSGFNQDYVLQQLRQTDAWKKRYAAIVERQRNGLSPISESDVLSYERAARQLMMEADLPSGFYDQPEDFVGWLGRDTSIDELRARVQDGYAAAQAGPSEVRDELGRLYNVHDLVGTGGLAAYYLDPTKALPILQRQLASAQLSGTAIRTGYGGLSATEAERLAAEGVTPDQARTGFGQLAGSSELFGALPGEQFGAISREAQLGATFEGDAASQDLLRRRAAARAAVFGAGGGFASAQGGLTGLASVPA